MDEFDFFRKEEKIFTPKTPVAALKAYETGFNPLEMFIFKSGSAKPLNEEPFDIEAIERFLSRNDLDLEANSILIGIFEKLIYSPDQELALFAAESINIIENRYNKKIEKAKKSLEDGSSTDSYVELGRLFFELAMINKSRLAIKKFYFTESYKYYTKAREFMHLEFTDLEIVIRILLELELYFNALDLLRRETVENDPFHLYLEAEIEFKLQNYSRVAAICRLISKHMDGFPEDKQNQIRYWAGV